MEDFFRKEQKDSIPTPQDTDSALVSSKATKQNTEEEDDFDFRHTRKSLDRLIARSLERKFTEVLDSVFAFSATGIKSIDIGEDHLEVVIHVPFWLPEPSRHFGGWLRTPRAQNKLRKGFAKYLRKPDVKRTLSNFFYTELSKYLLELCKIGRFSERVRRHLRTIAQRNLAGRPSHSIRGQRAHHIKKEGITIYRTLQKIQRSIERWKKANPQIDDPGILKKLRRSYSVKRHPWITFFFALVPKLPRRHYLDSEPDSTTLDADGKLLPAKLAEPSEWSIIDITAKILQARLLKDTKTLFPLRDIKRVLAPAILRQKQELTSISASRQ